LVAVAGCAAAALLLTSTAARPSSGHAAKPAFTFSVPAMVTPAVVGSSYPPKPYAAVSFCKPVPKAGATCGGYTFKIAKSPGKLPGGISVGATDGKLSGTPAWMSDLAQPTGSTSPGMFPFVVCAKAPAKGSKTTCKKSTMAVFTGLGGTWTGNFSGDSGAFTCNTPLSGTIKLVLTQKVTFTKGVPKSTVGGTITFTNLPPISPDGVQTGDCTMKPQTFGVTGTVANPGVSGPDEANGLWTGNIDAQDNLTGTLTIQDTGGHGFYSELSFQATKKD
jgi:hypothetical protein